MMRVTMLLSCMALIFVSHSVVAKSVSTDTEAVVKKYYLGKPGHNRRVVIVYQRSKVDEINYQIASSAPAAGLWSSDDSKEEKPKMSVRKRIVQLRHHP